LDAVHLEVGDLATAGLLAIGDRKEFTQIGPLLVERHVG